MVDVDPAASGITVTGGRPGRPEADRDHGGEGQDAERGETDEVTCLPGRAEADQHLGEAAAEGRVQRFGTTQRHRPVRTRRDTYHQRVGVEVQHG